MWWHRRGITTHRYVRQTSRLGEQVSIKSKAELEAGAREQLVWSGMQAR